MKKLTILLIIVTAFINCTTDSTSSNNSTNTRAHDPWVFRSVLDQIPRIITIAMDSNAWVAYRTDKASMYKVWDGGVSFEGAVYDYAHGPQPTSYGYAYTINKFENPWSLNSDGNSSALRVDYKGHRFIDDRVQLNYQLIKTDGKVITVSESPEVIKNEKGQRVFNRRFKVAGLASGEELKLKANVSSMIFKSDIDAQGKWTSEEETEFKFESKTLIEQVGSLSLVNGVTNFDVVMTIAGMPDPNLIEASLVDQSAAPLGLKLIAKNDCKTCHNTKVKTIGPAYVAVAKKYEDTEDNIKMLVDKVRGGGTGIWGEDIMNAHPDLSDTDLREMIKYVLSLDNPDFNPKTSTDKTIKTYKADSKVNKDRLMPGAITKAWDIGPVSKMPKATFKTPTKYAGILSNYDNLNGSDFKDLTENFALTGEGVILIEKEGEYSFRIWSDDGSILYLHDEMILDNDGNHGTEFKEITTYLKEGYHPFRIEFFQGAGGKFLSLNYKPFYEEGWMVVPASAIFHDSDLETSLEGKSLPMGSGQAVPGDQVAVEEVHPSFDLFQAKPTDFKPKVGGLDFMSDGSVVISTWDAKGPVYLITNPTAENPEDIKVKEIASGFAEPLGVKVVNDVIYVMQKQEITKLIDHDGDGIIDEYQTLCDDWGVTANFHEFGFGLDYKDGYFYATLATGILPGGASMPNQHKNRGNAIKISEKDGSIEFIAHGLRTPNGIGMGYNDEMFIADNQGDWLPASKILHVSDGAWFGSRSVDFEGTADLKEKKPVVWLPQDEIGNSPSTPSYLNVGPYKNQMIHGEVTNGGIKRVFVEEVEGELQGAVFRFIQGLDAGINRVRWAKDGSLYAGGIGNPGNWGHSKRAWYGLQRMVYNEKSTFEMLAVRAKSNGVEIEFTEALQEGDGWNKSDYEIIQWYYKPTIEYGGPKIDEKPLNIRSVNVSQDRKKVFLELDGMKEDHVVYIHLKDRFVSDQNHSLWSTESWYTMNQIPKNEKGFVSTMPAGLNSLNKLSKKEIAEGWELLFDGSSMDKFRRFKKDGIGSSWKIEDGTIHLKPVKENGKWKVEDGGDIMTKEQYENFHLKLEWKIYNCGNSGVFYNVVEGDYEHIYSVAPEMQILDNVCHPDTRYPTHRAGDLYDMIECKYVTVKPAGEWNKIQIISNNGEVEFWQNGYKVVEFTHGDEEWNELLKKSKFADWEGFGEARSGHIGLQDHSDPVWFRNIKIKKL